MGTGLTDELRARAAALLDPVVRDYYNGGSGDGQSAAEAAQAWRSYRLRPHVLRDVATVDTRTTVAGLELGLPVLAAPTALQGLAHAAAERATAQGCAAAGSIPVVSTRASLPLEQMGLAPGRWWMQLYVLQDRRTTHDLALRARDLGAAALVVTVDTPVVASRAGGRAALPRKVLRVAPGIPPADSADGLGTGEQAMDVSVVDLSLLAELTGLPVWAKGVLRGDDADRLVTAGVAGLIVSNHGGRQLDGAIATAHALPEVVDAVAGRVPVLVDGGVRNGRDVLTALTLGASAVLIGRPVLWGLTVGGAAGVAAVFDDLRRDLEEQFRLCGVTSVADLRRDLLVEPTRPSPTPG